MITFNDMNQEPPYLVFEDWYHKALDAGQKNVEAISISSYNQDQEEVDARFVNLKFVEKNKFIFFSNYNSPKAVAFENHPQISALIYWPEINSQIRMRAIVRKTTRSYNLSYFKTRSSEKNALAISSDQSKEINSYNKVIQKYEDIFSNKNLNECPDYWGGFYFIPYYFEFWEGHKSRLNKREVFNLKDGEWKKYFIQP